ncbi:MAG: DUF3613 domain-containing protein [Methylophilus sp.]
MSRLFICMLSGLLSIHISLAEEVQSLPTHATAAYPSAHPSSSQSSGITPSIPTLLPTQQWLELQRSGKSASTQAQPYSGEVMDKVHTRYLKSFEKPIPEFFEHEMRTAR